jgi:hypothetical protein
VFEYRVLSRIFRPSEVTGEWRKQHNEDLYNLYSSPDIIKVIKSKRMRLAGHVASIGEMINAYKIVGGKPEGKTPLGRPRRGWKENITMNLREMGLEGVDWIYLTQDRDRCWALVYTVMKLGIL